ncbi:MAG: hypothetical protein P8P74_04040 [Crocinitomicaceae bacterium]|nr:hypothetical protein [Crocinitomicaceae bacterium]
MKPVSALQKLFFFPFALLAFALILSVQNAPPAPKELSLDAAIKDGTIHADVVSNGKHSGKSVKLSVTNTTNRKLKIIVPAGTAYVPGDDEEQTLIQLEDDFFVLEPRATKNHMIAAFCTEASDMSPSSGGKFKISTSSNKKLNEAIDYMKDKKIDKMSFQDIVWAITDGHSVSSIQPTNPQTKNFRTYLANLTGQKDTWYTSPQRHVIDERRRIVSQTVAVRGQIEFASDGTSVIRQEVVDKDGEVRFKMPNTTPRKSHQVKMTFSVRVRGWEPGEYTLRVLKDDEEIKTYPFLIS